jgi:hypothetical protein
MTSLGAKHAYLGEKLKIMSRMADPKRFAPLSSNYEDWWQRLAGQKNLAVIIGLTGGKDDGIVRAVVQVSRMMRGEAKITPAQLMRLAQHFKLDACDPDAHRWLHDAVPADEFERLLIASKWADPNLPQRTRFAAPWDVLKVLGASFPLIRGRLHVDAFDLLDRARHESAPPAPEITRGVTSRHEDYLDLPHLAPLSRVGLRLDGAEGRWALVLNLDWGSISDPGYGLVCLAPGAQAPYRPLQRRDLLPELPARHRPESRGWLVTPEPGRQDFLVFLTAQAIDPLPWSKEAEEHRLAPEQLDRLVAYLQDRPELGTEIHHAPFLVLTGENDGIAG